MRRWLSHFTDEQLVKHPELTLAAANSDLLEGRRDPAQRWESAARRVLHETPPRKRPAALKATVAMLRAVAGRDGLERMCADAAAAYELEPEDSPWRPLCCLLEGVARDLAGERDVAAELLEEGARRGAIAAPNIQTLCLAQLALGASRRNDWESVEAFAARAMAQVGHYALADYPTSALVFAASAAARAHRGMVDEARDDLHRAERLLEGLDDFIAWYVVETRIALAATALRLSDAAAARQHLAGASRLAARLPDAPVLHAWIAATEEQLGVASQEPALLTTAELRILTFLPTHLSFREIAARLFVSANTVKSQAHAVYRKLDAASRSEAVTRAEGLGLLDL
jgi:LuxR family maltose regulon positive regulatory protein